MTKRFAVIMAGGKGERFWPLSTSRRPKQLLSILGGKPLVALAVERLSGLFPPDQILIITRADLLDATRAAAPAVRPENVIGEPVGRDTAAAVALASALVRRRDPDAVLCVLTADQVIGDIDVFQRTLKAGCAIASRQDVLITIGIAPSYAATGFGYVEAGDSAEILDGIELLQVRRFVEKPDVENARRYVAAGNFFWNSGMFMWSVSAIQKALSLHAPALYAMARRIEAAVGQAGFEQALSSEYAGIGKISIDYAVMEKSKNILMVRGIFPWDDVGSWISLENHFPKDEGGNLAIGDCESVDSTGNIVVSTGRLTALLGVRNLVVVQSEGVTLVCARDRAQEVKRIVELLGRKGTHGELL